MDIKDKIKNSILLPKTDFPMRGQLPQTEPKRIDQWTQTELYQNIQKKPKNKRFTMPDGPPYANGNLHVGHVLNKVLKDIVIKYKSMTGHQAAFIPGWDCHGLPIELKVTQSLGEKKKQLSDAKIREICRKEAMKWVETQKKQFIRLGVLADWENPYLTLQPEYEANEVRVLAQILRNGWLYRGEKPVYWCPALQTALAAAEVEYHDHTSPSIYANFALKDTSVVGLTDKPVSFVIWTTTPWTLPANYGICLNEKFDYGVFDTGYEYIIIAEKLKESIEKECDLELKLIKSFKGSELAGLKAQHPFIERESLVILGDHVTLEAGTGCVHTAPGHGLDDYSVGLKNQLPVFSPVDAAGCYTEDFAPMQGESIWDANPKIVELLKTKNALLGFKQITHSYPHNPRSKTPLIFRATPQWFVRMDGDEKSLRDLALKAVEEKITFVPEWGKQRLKAMVTNTPDWCLSRQRVWGVPIPVFYCESCEEAVADADVMDKVADHMQETKLGIEAYHQETPEFFLGDKKCSKCGHDKFKAGQDILDVWFDSGVCHTAVQKQKDELDYPADIYLEGSDQHRGWFQTSLMSSVAAYGEPPFKALITHGFVTDAQGYKMSKSKGNVIDPADIIKQYGAEILRLWVAYEDYGQDVNVGKEMFQRISETYRRIRNTLRFMLGNLNDFDPSKDKVDFKDMPALDQWALMRFNELIEKCTQSYEDYNFYKVYHALNNFFTVDLSATYLDILKDRLYTGKVDGIKRRSSQTVIYYMLNDLVKIMAPILSFIAEETFEYIPGTNKHSVFLEDFPKVHSEWDNPEAFKDMNSILEVRSQVSKVLEDLRKEKVIGSSLEAKAIIKAKGDTLKVLKKYEKDLNEVFIVSYTEIQDGEFEINAEKAQGEKCNRCWNYAADVNTNSEWPGVCPKCSEALS